MTARKASKATIGDRRCDVVVVGAGFGGIAAGVKLLEGGVDSFTIFESSSSVGGTWWDNQYPGCEVDVGSHLYSYSFAINDWTRTHARQPELKAYIERVADEFGVTPHIRLGTTVTGVVWDESTHTYEVHIADAPSMRANIVISATGFLNIPRYPDWPGLDDFTGPKIHTSRWDHEVDLRGKRVAVVGTGSSACQIVPEIGPIAGHTVVFMREPGWVLPKGERDFTDEERARLSTPRGYRRERWRNLARLEWGQLKRPNKVGSRIQVKREQAARAYIASSFAERPDLEKVLTPSYPFPGKRTIFATPFYPSLLRDDVELVAEAVQTVTPTGVVDASGTEHQVDVLITATGFQPTNYLGRLPVVGRDGRTLHEVWAGEPHAFLGLTVPGFPNFFMMYGPGTNGGEIVSMLERQAEFVVRVIRRMKRTGATAVEVKPRWERLYNRWLQRTMRNTSWSMTRNYFRTTSGKIVTQWLYGPTFYGILTKVLGRPSETWRRLPDQT